MNTYALIFYVLTFSFVGNPGDMVIHHELQSWRHPYPFESKEQCEETAQAINKQQSSIGYEHKCILVDKIK